MYKESTQGSYDPSTNSIRACKRLAVAIEVDNNHMSINNAILEPISTNTSVQNGTSTPFPILNQAYNSPKKIADNILTAPALSIQPEQLRAEL
eukprot:1853007-Ditylum_brightwellii.AAC.1